jgi:hypothetical protein
LSGSTLTGTVALARCKTEVDLKRWNLRVETEA